MLLMTWSLCHKNDRQRSVNDFRHSILEYHGAIRLLWCIIELSAAFLCNNAYDMIVTLSQNDCQRSLDMIWSCIFDNPTAIKCRLPTTNPSAARIRETASDDIMSTCYQWAPADRQHILCICRTLQSNQLSRAVAKSSFMLSVFAN